MTKNKPVDLPLRCGHGNHACWPTGNCYGNACSESFLHSLKIDTTHGERFSK